jgi:hypothetical protein
MIDLLMFLRFKHTATIAGCADIVISAKGHDVNNNCWWW